VTPCVLKFGRHCWRSLIRALQAVLCVLLPALAISHHKDRAVDKHVFIALLLMTLAPALHLLQSAGVAVTLAEGTFGARAVAGSYIAAQLYAFAVVFLRCVEGGSIHAEQLRDSYIPCSFDF